MEPGDYLPHILYINLDKRTDRLEHIQKELARMNLVGERIPALHTPINGGIGCTFSHIHGLKLARERRWSHVLILEDDFQFIVDKETLLSNLRDFYMSGIEYDVLFLSYNIKESVPVNNIISRGTSVQTASGYIVHQRFYDTLIYKLEEGLQLFTNTLDHSQYTGDQYWKLLQKTHIWYYFNTRIGVQRPSYSDIECKNVTYNL